MMYYTEVDSFTGETLTWSVNGSDDSKSVSRSKLFFTEDNDLVFFEMYDGFSKWEHEDGTTTYEEYKDDKIAYGNDNYGGIISIYDDRIDSEFYDENGVLLVKESGSTYNYEYALDRYDYNINTLFPFTSPPEDFKVKEVYSYDSDNITYYYQLEELSEWISFGFTPSDGWFSFYYSAESDPESLTILGERKYNCFDSVWNNITDGYEYVKGFSTSYSVPDQNDYFGQNYFLSQTYPLQQLLPLKESYASKYLLKQKETNSYPYDWDDDGKVDYTWNSYDFWLEDLEDDNGSVVNNDQINETDIYIRDLIEEDFYFWDYTNQTSLQTKGYVYIASNNILPDYFNFTKQNTVDSVKSEILALFNDNYNEFRAIDFTDQFNLDFPSDNNYSDLYTD